MIISNQPAAKHLWFIMLLTIMFCLVVFYPVLIRSKILLDIGWPFILSRVSSSSGSSRSIQNSESTNIRNSFHNLIATTRRIDSSNTIVIASDTAEEVDRTTATIRIQSFIMMKNAILSILKHCGETLNRLLSSLLLKPFLNLSRFWTNIFIKTPPAAAAAASKPQNDHVQIDMNTLSQRHRDIIMETYEFLRSNTTLSTLAEDTNYSITPHLVYRYYAAADWTALYNGKNYSAAIAETILWRKHFGICSIDLEGLKVVTKRAFAYLSAVADKHGRVIIYFKAANSPPDMRPEDYLKMLFYVINKAEERSLSVGSGEFVTFVDLADLTWKNCPPMNVLRQAIALLGKHYPYRLAGIYMVNSGGPFQFLWNIMKPLISKKVIGKTVVMGKASPKRDEILEEKLGLQFLEEKYGGKQSISSEN